MWWCPWIRGNEQRKYFRSSLLRQSTYMYYLHTCIYVLPYPWSTIFIFPLFSQYDKNVHVQLFNVYHKLPKIILVCSHDAQGPQCTTVCNCQVILGQEDHNRQRVQTAENWWDGKINSNFTFFTTKNVSYNKYLMAFPFWGWR